METKRQIEEPLLAPVMYLKGVGEHRARLLAKLGVQTVLDLMEIGRASCRERV